MCNYKHCLALPLVFTIMGLALPALSTCAATAEAIMLQKFNQSSPIAAPHDPQALPAYMRGMESMVAELQEVNKQLAQDPDYATKPALLKQLQCMFTSLPQLAASVYRFQQLGILKEYENIFNQQDLEQLPTQLEHSDLIKNNLELMTATKADLMTLLPTEQGEVVKTFLTLCLIVASYRGDFTLLEHVVAFCQQLDPHLLRDIIDKHADVTHANSLFAAVHGAFIFGCDDKRMRCINLLIGLRANPDCSTLSAPFDNNNRYPVTTPLELAVKMENVPLVTMLLHYKASVRKHNSFGKTALDVARKQYRTYQKATHYKSNNSTLQQIINHLVAAW